MTFMTHPDHGANNVSESDVPEQERHGWRVTSRAEWMSKKIAFPVGLQAGASHDNRSPAKRGKKAKGQ